MGRSDSSFAPGHWRLASASGSRWRYRALWERMRSPLVTHVPVPTIPAPTTCRAPVLGFALLRQARPPGPPNRVHLRSGLVFGSGPSPARLAAAGCRFLLEVLHIHRSSKRDLNPLATCAAGRTEVDLRRLGSDSRGVSECFAGVGPWGGSSRSGWRDWSWWCSAWRSM